MVESMSSCLAVISRLTCARSSATSSRSALVPACIPKPLRRVGCIETQRLTGGGTHLCSYHPPMFSRHVHNLQT